MQLSFIFTIFFTVSAMAVPLDRRDNKKLELELFSMFKAHLSKIGYKVEDRFCKNGVYHENIIESPEKSERNQLVSFRDVTAFLSARAKQYVNRGWDPSEFFCVSRAPAS